MQDQKKNNELKEDDDSIIDNGISCDGSYQRRGYSSLSWGSHDNIYDKWKSFGHRANVLSL